MSDALQDRGFSEISSTVLEWQHTFDAIKDAVFLLSPDHRILRFNKACYDLFHKSEPSEILGKFCWEVVHGTSEQLPACPLEVMKKTKKREISILKSGDKWLEVVVDPVLDEDNNVLGVVHIVSDITERKQAEDSLRSASSYSRNLIEASLDPLITISKEGKITDVNKATEKITGIGRESLIGTDFSDYFTEPEKARAGYLEVFENGQVLEYPLAIRHISGAVTDVLYNASLYRNEKGEVLGVFAAARDITERKRLETEKIKLEEKNRQLLKAESLGRMSGAVAHLFNNQLHVVLGYLEMVIGYLQPGDHCIAKLTTAMQAARKASEVSALLITYLGQKPVKLERVDIAELCRTSLPVFQTGKPEAVSLETDLPVTGPVISADSKQIQQLLNNLLINAWEAIGDGAEKIKTASRGAGGTESMERRHSGGIGNWNGKDKDCQQDAGGPVSTWNAGIPAGIGDRAGTINLSVRKVSRSEIPLSHRFPPEWIPKDNFYACMEVTDSGCGIDEKDFDKIFDPFFSTKFTGRGLGLSVVLGIVKVHNSLITVENGLDGGSVFSVFFPISKQTAPLLIEQVAKAPKSLSGGAVLLVEDEEEVRKMTAIMLDSFGFTVLQAKDGVEAVEIFAQRKDEISCLLCDLTMPRMGGWETISAIRAIRHDLPVILASGYDEASVMVAEHPEMPDFFLNKPYAIKKLEDTLGSAMALNAHGTPASPDALRGRDLETCRH